MVGRDLLSVSCRDTPTTVDHDVLSAGALCFLTCSHRSNANRHRLANIIDADNSTVEVAVPVASLSSPARGGSSAEPA
jgi:hypothetical protein